MPILNERESIGGLTSQQSLQPDSADSPYVDLLGTAYDVVTVQGQIGQAGGFIAQSKTNVDRTPDPNFNLNDEDFSGYEDIALPLLQSRNKQEADFIKKQFDYEKEQEKYLSEAGFKGVLATLHAATTDLTNFIPVVGMEKAAFNISRVGKIASAAKTGAAYGFAISAGQEAIAQETRISRSAEESLYNIGATTIFAGALGGSLGYVAGRGNVDEIAESFAKESSAYADNLAVRYGDSVGAASVQKTTIEQETLKSALGLEKVLAKTSPTMGLMNSPSVESRRTIQQLADITLDVRKFDEGIAAPIPVESLIRQHEARLTIITPKTFDDYMHYRSGRNARAGDAVVTGARDLARGAPNGKLTFSQFREEVGKAMARNDEHEIAEVSAAAKRYRKEVFDPLKDEAIKLGLLPPNIQAKTAATYISRLYNTQKIAAQRPDFESRIAAWLKKGNEFSNQKIDDLTKQVNVVESVIESQTKRLDDVNKRMDELLAKDAESADDFVQRQRSGEKKESALTKAEKDEVKRLKAEADDATQIINTNKAKSANFKAATQDVWKIASMSDDDLKDLASQITDGLIGQPAGKLNYEGVPLVRGPLKERTLLITDAEIEDFLDRDIFRIAQHYSRNMSADVELTRAFGKADMRDQIMAVSDDYRKLRDSASEKLSGDALEKKLASLDKMYRNDVELLEGVRDRLRHTYGIPANPMGLVSRSFRAIKTANFLRLLGGMTIAAFSDVARPVAIHGIMRSMSDGVLPLVKNVKQAKLSMSEVKLSGTALDMINNERALAMAGLDNTWMQTSKFERGLDALADNYKFVTLMAPWNAFFKQFVGMVSQTRSLEAIEMIAKGGAAAKKEISRLAMYSIDESMAKRIWAQVSVHGKKDGIWWANTDAWTDLGATKAYRAAMQREVDKAIVTTGQELPLFISTQTGGVMLQFKSFALSATQRILVSGLQQRDAAALNGFLLSTALGMLIYRTKTDHDKLSDDPAKWLQEGIDRSGALGWFTEANNIIEKVSGGAVGVGPALGTGQATRYSSRGAASAVFGPTYGTVFDTIVPLIGAAANGEVTASDIHKLRQMLPYQNLFYIRSLLDQLEEGTVQSLGIKQKKKQ